MVMTEIQLSDKDRKSLINYRLEQADDALQTASENISGKHYNAAINRLYYACFYALSALLIKCKYEFDAHQEAKTILGQHFIATNKIPRKYSTIYGQLFSARHSSDYEAFIYFEEEKTQSLYNDASDFVAMIKEFLSITE